MWLRLHQVRGVFGQVKPMNPAPPVTRIFFPFRGCAMAITISLYPFVEVNRVYVEVECYKDFSDLLSFLTIIPLAQTEEFVLTSARNMFLFPLMGGLIGLFAAGYFFSVGFVVSNLFGLANSFIGFPWVAVTGGCLGCSVGDDFSVFVGVYRFSAF